MSNPTTQQLLCSNPIVDDIVALATMASVRPKKKTSFAMAAPSSTASSSNANQKSNLLSYQMSSLSTTTSSSHHTNPRPSTGTTPGASFDDEFLSMVGGQQQRPSTTGGIEINSDAGGKRRSSAFDTTSSTASSKQQQQQQRTLLEIVRTNLLQDVFQHSSTSLSNQQQWMVLVVDSTALRVISSSIGMYNLMEHRVSIVEDLMKVRAPFRDMAVLYVVEPTAQSVQRIINDWTPTKKSTGPLYGDTIFLYFLGHLSDTLFTAMKQCKQLVSRIKILKEINLNFITKEAMAFHLDNMNSISGSGGEANVTSLSITGSIYTELYITKSSSSTTAISPLQKSMIDKLVTVCATLNEYPHVRYKDGNSNSDSNMKQLAHLFQQRMNEFVGLNSHWWYNGDGLHPNTDRATLLLLDRSVDCLSPLIHEFTYEAMVYDLLPNIDTDGHITYDNVINNNKEGGGGGTTSTKMDALLNDNDEIWKELRGKHIADVIQILSTKIRDIVNSSSVAPVIGGKKGSSDSAGGGGGGGALSIDQMAKALKALPEYREIMSKLSQHMQIAHQCMDAFNKQGLLDLSDVEQTMATGKSDVGRVPKLKEMLGRVVEQFRTATGNNSSAMRLRLLAIVIISQHGIAVDDLQKLLKEANLSRDELRTFHNLEKLSCPLVRTEDDPSSVRKRDKLVAKVKGEGPGRLRPYHHAAERGGGESDSEYSSSRYVCLLKSIMEDAAQGKLSVEDYPSVLPLPDAESMLAPTAKAYGKSVRKPSMNTFSASTATQSTNVGKKKAASGGRQIVFMVGGMCYSELRSAREVMNTTGTEIVIGSTRCITPKDFIDDLNSLG